MKVFSFSSSLPFSSLVLQFERKARKHVPAVTPYLKRATSSVVTTTNRKVLPSPEGLPTIPKPYRPKQTRSHKFFPLLWHYLTKNEKITILARKPVSKIYGFSRAACSQARTHINGQVSAHTHTHANITKHNVFAHVEEN